MYSAEKTNNFVDLSFHSASKTATCLFLHQQESSRKSCSIVYGLPGKTCTALSHQCSSSVSDSVYIGFPINDQLQPQSEYCFTVTASNGTFTTKVEGLLFTGISE